MIFFVRLRKSDMLKSENKILMEECVDLMKKSYSIYRVDSPLLLQWVEDELTQWNPNQIVNVWSPNISRVGILILNEVGISMGWWKPFPFRIFISLCNWCRNYENYGNKVIIKKNHEFLQVMVWKAFIEIKLWKEFS